MASSEVSLKSSLERRPSQHSMWGIPKPQEKAQSKQQLQAGAALPSILFVYAEGQAEGSISH